MEINECPPPPPEPSILSRICSNQYVCHINIMVWKGITKFNKLDYKFNLTSKLFAALGNETKYIAPNCIIQTTMKLCTRVSRKMKLLKLNCRI